MVTISSDKTIITGHSCLTAGSNSLLSVIQMAETANFTLLVELIREDLHSAHDGHLLKEEAKLVLRDSRFIGENA